MPLESVPTIDLPDIDLTCKGELSSDDTGSDHASSEDKYSVVADLEEFVLPPTPSLEDINIPEMASNYITSFEVDETPILYPGAPVTARQAVCTLVAWFSSNPGISKSAFSRLLFILHTFILPAGNSLPQSYNDALKMLRPFLSPVKDYHCCVNDCIIFRDSHIGDYAQLSVCPECGEDRYKAGTRIPRKRFKYLPLETRVRRLFSDKITSKLLQSHNDTKVSAENKISTIHQSEAWKSWYSSEGIFKGDTRALSFAVCLDGLNPFSREKASYSTCPIFLSILNLPHHVRMLSGSAMLTGLIAGPNEPKSTNPYVDVLVDDILHLNTLKVYDGYKDEMFPLKANIILNIFDYPGQNKVLQCQGVCRCMLVYAWYVKLSICLSGTLR